MFEMEKENKDKIKIKTLKNIVSELNCTLGKKKLEIEELKRKLRKKELFETLFDKKVLVCYETYMNNEKIYRCVTGVMTDIEQTHIRVCVENLTLKKKFSYVIRINNIVSVKEFWDE